MGEENPTVVANGNLTVSVYQIEKTPFEAFTRTAASEACARLNFAVYTLDGTRVKQINQTSDAADFGNVSFNIEKGTYQLVVVGHSSSGNPTMTDPNKIQFTNALGYTDTFLYYGQVTVGDDPLDKQVTLDRIVSPCRFIINDDFPSDVKQMKFHYTGGSGAFDAATGFGCVNSKQEVKVDASAAQKQFDLYTFLHDTEGTIHLTVTALDASGSDLYSREYDVEMEQNYITKLTVDFFNRTTSSSTTISAVTVNTTWAGERTVSY